MTGETCTLYQRWTANKSYPPPIKSKKPLGILQAASWTDQTPVRSTWAHTCTHQQHFLACFKTPAPFQKSLRAISRNREPTLQVCCTNYTQTADSSEPNVWESTREFGAEVLGSSSGVFEVLNSVKVLSQLICCVGAFKWTSSSERTL